MLDFLGFQTYELTEFPGQRAALHDVDLPAEQGAKLALNVEFFDGRVRTRRGFGDAFTANPSANRVGFFRQWLMPTWNWLMMFIPHATAPKVRYRDLNSTIEDDVVTGLPSTVTTADFQEYGSRMFMAFMGDDGLAKSRPRVWNGSSTGGPNVDLAFLGPPFEGSNFNASYSEFGSGVVDAGPHRIGLLFETRTGFTTKAIRLNADHLATGGKSLNITLTPVGNWNASYTWVSVLMTTVQNPERFWIVPGSRVAIPGGSSGSVNILVDIADTTLAALNAQDAEATKHFSTYVYGDGGVNMDAKALISYGGRMVYIVDYYDANAIGNISHAVVSDTADPQKVSLDQHALRLPGNLPITTGAVMNNLLYLVGPAWIYSVSDNLDLPVTWGDPQLVDGRLGTPCPHGLGKDPSRGIIWIASPKGLFPFDGASLPDKPTSYYQVDVWQRINWSAPKGALKVVVDGASSNVVVVAPLDSATVPTHVLAWNYRNGVSYQRVDFSLWTFQSPALSTVGGAGIVVRNSIPELWLGNFSTAAQMQRQKSGEAGDAQLWQDGSSGIASEYITGDLPRTYANTVNHHAAHLNVLGEGTVVLSAEAKGTRTKTLSPAVLSTAPKGMLLRRISLKSEGMRLKLSNNGVAGAWWSLSFLRLYWKSWFVSR